jgi:hypothetical protein
MKNVMLSVIATALTVAVVPAALEAQAPVQAQEQPAAAAEGGTAPAQQAAPAAGATAQQLAARIQAIQQQAMQDPAVAAASREVNALITAALPRVEPNYPTYAARAQSLQTDVAAAQAAGDNAKLHELAAEARTLQANISSAQARAKEDPAVKERLEAYTAQLFAKMVEIEPTVRELVAQLEAARSTTSSAAP